MLVALFSDSHDNIPNIDKAIEYITNLNITTLIHSGDISSGKTFAHIAKNFPGSIYSITGNASDTFQDMQTAIKKYKNVTLFDETGTVEIDSIKIAFNHYPWEADKLAKSGKYNLVLHGHDHKPWEKMIGKTKVLNPGTLAGIFQKPTFAIYDTQTNKAQLILIEKI